ncbi:hypothetical protein DL93DRAFT_2069976, partial [Clavulina sp. PMI_390]
MHSADRGTTGWSSILHDHSVAFNEAVELNLEVPIDRESRELHPSKLKLEVLLRPPSGSRREEGTISLGAVYIDVSQYVLAGSDTRRHLLQKSKTNALLRVSLKLTQIGGDKDFIAPTLPRAQLLSGLAGLLDRERTLVAESNSGNAPRLTSTHSSASNLQAHLRPSGSPRSAFSDAFALTSSSESIIDALFNPYTNRSSSETQVSTLAPQSNPPTPSLLTHNSAPSDRFTTARPSDPPLGVLRPLLKRDPSPQRRQETLDKRPKWWKIGSQSRPTTPNNDPTDAASGSGANLGEFGYPNALNVTSRKPPSIAITHVD